jgi:hypothetical protein
MKNPTNSMASLSLGGTGTVRGLHATRKDRQYFVVLCGILVALNLFTFLYHLSAVSVFNTAGYAVGVVLLAYSVRVAIVTRSNDPAGRVYLTCACLVTFLGVLYNWPAVQPVDILKYLSIYIFYAAGRASGGPVRPVELRCIYVLAALPIVFLLGGSSKIYDSDSIAYLPNANTMVLYYSAMLFAIAPLYGNYVILLQFINAAVMNKIGAIVATVVAVGMWVVFPLRRESIIGLILVGIAGVIALVLGAFDRAIGAFEGLMFVYRLDPSTVASMSYKELVHLTGSTDLSGFFRLIHWTNIWDLYSDGGVGTWLLGYGPGQTVPLTYAELVPHNDYLRILAEYGVINLMIFAGFLVHVRRGLATGGTQVLFIVLCVYFFSENLLDNFTSMALYFAYAGRAAAASDGEAVKARWKHKALARNPAAR